jgi:HEPN domain-containing protein
MNQHPQRTHDIAGLLRICTGLDEEFNALYDDAIDLTPFSTATRYPDDYYVFPDLTTANILYAKASKILVFVEEKTY